MKKLKNLISYLLLPIVTVLVFSSCARSPKPIEYGKDNCAFCNMTIMDKKWGAEYVSDKGKLYKFDSIECLISFYLKQGLSGSVTENSLWTVDYTNENGLINAENSFYLKSASLKSPMGLNVASFGSLNDLKKFQNNEDKVISWLELLPIVKAGW